MKKYNVLVGVGLSLQLVGFCLAGSCLSWSVLNSQPWFLVGTVGFALIGFIGARMYLKASAKLRELSYEALRERLTAKLSAQLAEDKSK